MSLFSSISGFISSAIVGQGEGQGGMAPLAETASSFFSSAPRSRTASASSAYSSASSGRGSTYSSGQALASYATDPSPPAAPAAAPPPGLDLSHLSEAERRQIEAVMARASGDTRASALKPGEGAGAGQTRSGERQGMEGAGGGVAVMEQARLMQQQQQERIRSERGAPCGGG